MQITDIKPPDLIFKFDVKVTDWLHSFHLLPSESKLFLREDSGKDSMINNINCSTLHEPHYQ